MSGWRKRTIMEMAQEAGIGWAELLGGTPEFLEAFAKLVREDEREACAKVCDDIHAEYEAKDAFSSYAEAIRARGQA
jgi:hypothetical protein